jgi:uncharacterized damage-inducible protein DinB
MTIAMTIAQSMLPELDHEMQTTRALLERVPEDKADWKPHGKSSSLGALAAHLASLVSWTDYTFDRTVLDFAAPDAPRFPSFSTTAALLADFDARVQRARGILAGVPDQDMMVPWTLKNGDHEIFTMPRVAVQRTFVMNHLIHHRGQLSVYLRLNDVPLPSIYGPTADSAG